MSRTKADKMRPLGSDRLIVARAPRIESLESRQLFSSQTFSNITPIQIPAAGTGAQTGSMADQWPSSIQVSGLDGTISKVTVSLTGLEHSYDLDIDIVLVGPTGRSVILMSDAGDARSGLIDLTFDDAGIRLPVFTPLASGTYRPTNYNLGDALPEPIPQSPSGLLSTFNGTSGNGTWSLYVLDDAPGDVGVMHGGWSISIQSDLAPPKVINSVFLDYSATHRLQYAFDKSIADSVADQDFSIWNLTTDEMIPAADFSVDYDLRSNTLGMSYLGNGGVMPDGYYRVKMNASTVHDDGSLPLDGNGDGVGGDDYFFDFAFLAADANKDRVVDSEDFNAFIGSYGKSEYVYYFSGDFDYSGKVNTLDFNILAGQFGKDLGPLPAPSPNPGPASGLGTGPGAGARGGSLPNSAPAQLPTSSLFSLVPVQVGDRTTTLVDWQ